MVDEVTRAVLLGEEVRLAVDLLKGGLGHLQRISGSNDRYEIPLQLLGGGFERLMKAIVCYRILEAHGRFPTSEELKAGHDLEALVRDIIEADFTEEYLGGAAAREDKEFLASDPRFRAMLHVLSEFGKGPVRYRNLDVVRGKETAAESALDMWSRIEQEVLDELGGVERLRTAQLGPLYQELNPVLVAGLERAGRALCRLFTLAGLGVEAKRQTGVIGDFLFLTDENLGRAEYALE